MIRLDGRKLAMLCMMAVCVLMLAQPAPANEAATSESADGVGTLDGLRAGRIPTMLDAGATDPLTLAANGLDETYWAQSGIDMGDDVDIYGFEKKSPRRAFLQSFLIPGWGQYYARGAWWKTVAFLGIEAASIYGAINFNSNGNDMEAEYEAFADAHWSGKDYVIGLKQVFYPNNEDAWDFRVEGTDTTYNWAIDTMLYTILVQGEFGQEPEERRWSHHAYFHVDSSVVAASEYYENIGKYHQFNYGWDDYPKPGEPGFPIDYKDSAAIEFVSQNRKAYLQMRDDANQEFKKASTMLVVTIANHLVSGVEAAISARRYNRSRDQFGAITPKMRWVFSPTTGRPMPQLSLGYRF